MRSYRVPYACLFAIIFLLGLTGIVQAQPSRVFVSAQRGDDANACENIQTPCLTFQGAVNQVAVGGHVIAIDSGDYRPVVIDKSLTLEAGPGILALVHAPSSDGVRIRGDLNDVVVLRGLAVTARSTGILVNIAGSVYVDRCVVNQSLVGVSFNYAQLLSIKDSTVRGSRGGGVIFDARSAASRAVIENSTIESNAAGIVLSGGQTAIRNSRIASNQAGVIAASEPGTVPRTEVTLEDCLVADNSLAGIRSQAFGAGFVTTVRVSNSTVTGNEIGLEQLAKGEGTSFLLSRINNTVEANTADTSGTIGTYAAR